MDEVIINNLTIRAVNVRTIAELSCEDLTELLKERAKIFLYQYKGGKDTFNEVNLRMLEKEIENINLSELIKLKYTLYTKISETGVSRATPLSFNELYNISIYNVKNNLPFKITVLPLTKKDKDFRVSYLNQEFLAGRLNKNDLQKELGKKDFEY